MYNNLPREVKNESKETNFEEKFKEFVKQQYQRNVIQKQILYMNNMLRPPIEKSK